MAKNEKQKTDTQPAKKKKKNIVWRILKWVICTVVLLILLAAGGIYYYYNYGGWKSIVRDLVHTYGSAATGTNVDIGAIHLALSDGNGSIGNITVGNPKDYTQSHIIKLGNIAVKVNKDSIVRVIKNATDKSIKNETIVIDEVRIDKPEVTYELMNFTKNNVDDLTANLNKNSASAQKAPEPKDPNAKNYNLAIKKVVITDGSATVAANLLGVSQSLTLPLPTITVNNLGTEKQGISIESGLIRIFQEILKSTTNVVSKADLSSILGGVGDLAGAAVDTAGQAAGAVVGGAGKAAGAAVEGAGAAVDGVTSGVKGIADGVGGLFK